MEAISNRPKNMPGPNLFQLLPLGIQIKQDPLATYLKLQRRYNDIAYFSIPTRPYVFVYHPDLIRHILKDNHTNYVKGAEYQELKPLLGNGLLTSSGEVWRQQRRLMAREFHGPSIDDYIPQMQSRIKTNLEELKPGIMNIDKVFSQLTFQLAGEIFFGANVEKFTSKFGVGLAYETEKVRDRIHNLFNFPMSIPTPENLKRKKIIGMFDNLVQSIMAEDHTQKSHNVLTKLMSSGELPPQMIRDEVMTLLLAGHETTSNTMIWTTWLLGKNPDWQKKIKTELKEFGKKASELTRADTLELKTFRAVIFESLRLMPPIPGISRMALEDDVMDGYEISSGTSVVCQPWVTHRDPRFWPQPELWNPARFLNRPERKDDFTFFPFARGARACIGEDLAMVEATLILAHLVEDFHWEVAPDFEPIPVHHLTLQSKNGMLLNLKPQN